MTSPPGRGARSSDGPVTSLASALFAPRRVAIVASDRPGSVGALLARNLGSFPGEVFRVGAGGSLRDLPAPVDLAVVAVPAVAVPAVAADAAAAGVTAMVVLSGGFAETGPDGAALQAELLRAAAGRVRVIGPNCFGIQNCDLPLDASIATGLPLGGGGISLVTQSGAAAMAAHDLAHDERVRFAKIVAAGNTCDVTITEMMDALAADPATRTVCFLLESLRDGRAFVEHARRVAAARPVIVLASGRSGAGARAAASHTAALASGDAVRRGVFRQCGIVEVRSGAELFDVARATDTQPLPRGPRVAIVTNSGGTGVELADLLADEGLDVPVLGPALQERIRGLLPPYAGAANPIDVTPAWSLFATVYPALVDLLARSGEVDAVVPVLLQRAASDADCARGLRETVHRLRAEGNAVPVYVCWSSAPRTARAHADSLQDAGVPVLDGPARTARALGRARAAALARVRLSRPPPPGRSPASPAVGLPDPGDPPAVAGMLRASGIDVVDAALCTTAEQAVAAAGRHPGRAVVKIARSAHRSDSGGVRTGLRIPDEVRAAAAELLSRGGEVLVSPHVEGIEVAIGATRDPAFGAVVMVGLGGIWVEVLADTAFALAPLDRRDARDLLTTLRAFPLLTGGRGRPPVDLDALADVVVRAGDLLTARPDLHTLDLNPVIATGSRAVAVDWKVIPRDGAPGNGVASARASHAAARPIDDTR